MTVPETEKHRPEERNRAIKESCVVCRVGLQDERGAVLGVESCALRICWCCHQLGGRRRSQSDGRIRWRVDWTSEISHQSTNRLPVCWTVGESSRGEGRDRPRGWQGRAGQVGRWDGMVRAPLLGAAAAECRCPGARGSWLMQAVRRERAGGCHARQGQGRAARQWGLGQKGLASGSWPGRSKTGAGGRRCRFSSVQPASQPVNERASSSSPTNVSPGSWKRFSYTSTRPHAASFRLR